jgi:diguanylate cyclase (GGDEF)-like protein
VQQTNDNLESKAQARTQDLTDVNKKLHQVINEREQLESCLKQEVGTDFLTQLPSGLSNQRFGWDAGDHILITISKLLQSQLGEAAMIGRLGGNQFAVYLKKTTKTSAKTTARGIADCISGFPFKWKDHSIQIGVYIDFCMVDSGESSARLPIS